MDKKWESPGWSSVAKGAAVGAGGSMVATLALTALAAGLVNGEQISETGTDYLTVGILILSAMAGALIAAAIVGHRRLLTCIASGAGYLLLLPAAAMLLFDGVNGTFGVTALAVLGGAGGAALAGIKEGRKGQPRRRVKKRNW